MNVREENKKNTRNKILLESKNVLLEKGYIKTSTRDISERCKVSQGTIFLHFETKLKLINYILIQLISDMTNDLQSKCVVTENREVFLREFLNVISRHENVLSVVYKDYIHLSDDVKKAIDQFESNIKSLFFDNLRSTQGRENSIVDSFIFIDGFLSQIRMYIYNKEFKTNTSVIKQSTGKLNKLYKNLFQ